MIRTPARRDWITSCDPCPRQGLRHAELRRRDDVVQLQSHYCIMTGILRLSLVDQQLKHFKLGLQALSKIGTELLVEALPSRVRALA